MRIVPNNAGLGARVEAVDLGAPLQPGEFRTLLRALGQYGVLCFPGQDLDAPALSAFAGRFGELEVNVANLFHAPGYPEIMILSNMKDAAGRPVGLHDAGQGWHTDMSYSREIALANVLHAKTVPMRGGRRSATRSSATCTPPTTTCRRRCGSGSRAASPSTTSRSSGR